MYWEEIAGQRGASARLARRGFPFGRAGETEGQAPAGGVAGGGRQALRWGSSAAKTAQL